MRRTLADSATTDPLRVVISTDSRHVSRSNAVAFIAAAKLAQQFRPLELWWQGAWLFEEGKKEADNGHVFLVPLIQGIWTIAACVCARQRISGSCLVPHHVRPRLSRGLRLGRWRGIVVSPGGHRGLHQRERHPVRRQPCGAICCQVGRDGNRSGTSASATTRQPRSGVRPPTSNAGRPATRTAGAGPNKTGPPGSRRRKMPSPGSAACNRLRL